MRDEENKNGKRDGDAVRNLRPLDELFERWGEGVFSAREVLSQAARRSGEEARNARKNLRAGNVDRAERGSSGFASAFDLAAGVAEESRSQSFLGAWALLAAGDRLGRPLNGRPLAFPFGLPFGISGQGAASPRTLALLTAAMDLYSGYAALRGRERVREWWFPGDADSGEVKTQHRRGAGRALDVATSLGGALIKAGQFASTRPDLLPAPYIETLSALHDRVPPRPFAIIRKAVEKETGTSLARTFSRFDPEPVAAASIAQVHRARLLDGREVAVKVRYPEAPDLVDADLDSLETVFDLVARLEPDVRLHPITDYLRWTLPMELDLARESEAMDELRQTLSDRDDVIVPRPVEGLASEGLLVMEFVEGVKVTDRAALVENGIDPAALARLLNDVYADQLFRRGVLHADPHPGNLLAQNSPNGPRLVLLDHGLTLPLEREFTDTLAKMVASLRDFDLDALEDSLREAGLPIDEDTDISALLQLVGVVMNTDGADGPTEGSDGDDALDLGGFAGKLGAGIRDLPPRLLLVGRAIGLLDGITRQLDEDLDSLEIVARYVREDASDRPAPSSSGVS